jgi:hypothetical protein
MNSTYTRHGSSIRNSRANIIAIALTLRLLLTMLAPLLFLGACASTERMMQITPFSTGELSDPNRINLWPLLYKSGERTSALWPLFDVDEKGFALRPLVALNENSVSILGPIGGRDWNRDTWWLLPAYKLEDVWGVLPLFGLGEKFGHVGPAYWVKDDPGRKAQGVGLFPIGYYGRKWGYFGTAWWSFDDKKGLASGGLSPLMTLGDKIGQVGPVFWDNDADERSSFLTVLPLFHSGREGDNHIFLTPLGGRGWSTDGETRFANIMGPIFHRYWRDEETATHVLWPLFHRKTAPNMSSTRLLPLFSREVKGKNTTTSALLWLFNHKHHDGKKYTRLWPLFTVSDLNSRPGLFDFLTLYANLRDEKASRIQIGSGFVFQLTRGREQGERDSDALPWDDEQEVTTSSLHLLWYLVRVNRVGQSIHRDFFPFISWDSSPERSRFSFLHRVFSYERSQAGSRYHVFFIPLN